MQKTLRLAINAIKLKNRSTANGKYGFNLNKEEVKHITHRLYPVSGTQRLCKNQRKR